MPITWFDYQMNAWGCYDKIYKILQICQAEIIRFLHLWFREVIQGFRFALGVLFEPYDKNFTMPCLPS